MKFQFHEKKKDIFFREIKIKTYPDSDDLKPRAIGPPSNVSGVLATSGA